MFHFQIKTIICWIVITWCLLTTLTEGYPYGAPPTACGAMIPGHNDTMPQVSLSPYVITVSRTTYLPGQSIEGKITFCLENLCEFFQSSTYF